MGVSSSTGLISGIDTATLISGLMAVEKVPLTTLQTKLSSYSTKISAFGTIKSNLSTIQTAAAALKDSSSLALSAVSSSDTAVATATTSGGASVGNYSLSVTKLAQANKIITNSSTVFSDTSTAISNTAGSLHLSSGDNSFDVNLSADSSLEEIKNAINSNNDNTSIVASIINDGTSYRLTLTAKDSGADSTIAVTNTSSSGGAGLDVFDTTKSAYSTVQEAQDASFKVDGISFTRSSNTFSDVIDGVTLTLKAADETTPKTSSISVTTDMDSIKAKVNTLIDAYNAMKSNVDTLRAKDGRLEADNTALEIEEQLKSLFASSTSASGSSYSYLSEIGISFQKDGTLSLDSTKFEEAVNSDPSSVQNLFSDADNGFAYKIYNASYDMTKTGGLLANKTKSLTTLQTTTQDRIDSMTTRLTKYQARLEAQFAAMETALSKLNTMSSYISGLSTTSSS